VYDNVKGALRAYELVPEAYRQRFRSLKKTSGQTYVDFAREKKILFDRWCRACKADDITLMCELMMLEEFKNCVLERTVVNLNEQKVSTLQQAATLADEFALTHKSVFSQRDPPHQERDPPQRDSYHRSRDTYVPRASFPVSGPKLEKPCFFCHNPGHLIADCAALKRKQAATMADVEEIVLSHSGVLAHSNSHRVGFRKARNRRATHAHSVSLPGPKEKRLCFLTLVT